MQNPRRTPAYSQYFPTHRECIAAEQQARSPWQEQPLPGMRPEWVMSGRSNGRDLQILGGDAKPSHRRDPSLTPCAKGTHRQASAWALHSSARSKGSSITNRPSSGTWTFCRALL